MPVIWQWVAGIGIPLVVAAGWIWWHVENGQNKRIEKNRDLSAELIGSMRTCNHNDHLAIRKEIVATKDQMTRQHNALRDKVDEVWQFLVKQK